MWSFRPFVVVELNIIHSFEEIVESVNPKFFASSLIVLSEVFSLMRISSTSLDFMSSVPVERDQIHIQHLE